MAGLQSQIFKLQASSLQHLFDALKGEGYKIVGPTIRDGAIVYDELESINSLPIGWTDEQDGGTYRIKRRGDNAFFGYNVGPHSYKRFLHPQRVRLWKAERKESGFRVIKGDTEGSKLAFFGIRPCEIHSLTIQDKVFINEGYIDPVYAPRRKRVFIVAVNCGEAGGTCFCASMGTGPKASSNFDLALTEVIEKEHHYFVVKTGTEQGLEAIREIPHRHADEPERMAAEEVVRRTAERMGRRMDTNRLKELLYSDYEHPRWDDVASRCLACGNCTMVCPTCFCTTVEDTTDLTGHSAERWRRWDSCFTLDFSYLHGGSIRSSHKARYRQWMTHKLATWIDQFGVSGCVGCGRCITWCPAGIDITEEVRVIRGEE